MKLPDRWHTIDVKENYWIGVLSSVGFQMTADSNACLYFQLSQQHQPMCCTYATCSEYLHIHSLIWDHGTLPGFILWAETSTSAWYGRQRKLIYSFPLSWHCGRIWVGMRGRSWGGTLTSSVSLQYLYIWLQIWNLKFYFYMTGLRHLFELLLYFCPSLVKQQLHAQALHRHISYYQYIFPEHSAQWYAFPPKSVTGIWTNEAYNFIHGHLSIILILRRKSQQNQRPGFYRHVHPCDTVMKM